MPWILGSFSLLALVVAGGYWVLLRQYRQHWTRLPGWSVPTDFTPTTSISVLVPARNEAGQIEACLQRLCEQDYPPELLDIIVIDDHSTDATPALVKKIAATQPSVRLLHLADYLHDNKGIAFKKAAITYGIEASQGELIVCTDADCLTPTGWLRLIASCYQEQQPACICGPVNIYGERNILERFQALDFMGMMLITGAGIQAGDQHLANGANLAYPRTVFQEVGGFTGADHLASGDDILLVHKIATRYPGRVVFLKNPAATVLTPGQPTLSAFFQQRLRWATKNSYYPQQPHITLALALVLVHCWLILVSAALLPFMPSWFAGIFLLQYAAKAYADFRLQQQATRFFGRKDLLAWFIPTQWMHTLYIAVIGFLAIFIKRYTWKGRPVK
ncbi:MAG: glycosyltransferase [Lewinellaceae bacterium]|nr:glycosyltransferase [Lewinellaceae bacterium]